MSKARVFKASIPPPFQLPKWPNWYVLPQPNITDIQADHRIETEIDATGTGRVRVKQGYNVNVGEIRYTYGTN